MLTVIIITANRVTKMPQAMHNDVTGEAVVVYKPVDVRNELTVSPPVVLPGVTWEAVVVYKPEDIRAVPGVIWEADELFLAMYESMELYILW